MRRKISFADFCYGVTSTAVVLQAKRLNTQYSAAHVRQLLILYHGAKPHGILAMFSVVPEAGRENGRKISIIAACGYYTTKKEVGATFLEAPRERRRNLPGKGRCGLFSRRGL